MLIDTVGRPCCLWRHQQERAALLARHETEATTDQRNPPALFKSKLHGQRALRSEQQLGPGSLSALHGLMQSLWQLCLSTVAELLPCRDRRLPQGNRQLLVVCRALSNSRQGHGTQTMGNHQAKNTPAQNPPALHSFNANRAPQLPEPPAKQQLNSGQPSSTEPTG